MESPAAIAFGNVLKRLRNQRAMSQNALATAAEVHRVHISRLERGERAPSLETMLLLCQALGVSLTAMSAAIEAELLLRR
ncbi:helix-turn-helix domain-containing protein [Burkholderia pseudomallei]|nr:helix-turn-helix transcriptional regulator [Burkholderia pseudomallei]MBF3523515.1 helix-turn-helix transcriptional regulator [Burkholderia pseudomallei]MBM5588524.1 helix-turn-helix domain-containing protein [Burkholderia pseudomallei]MBM5690952.1 helix-turn-helix domain-containing protein [Burkholderia pseudomallei]